MARNVAQKILDEHLVCGNSRAGAEAGIRIDQTLTQDATGTMAYLQFEAMGFSRVKTELSVSYVDHNTIQEGFENADDHRYLQSVAAKFGVKFSRAGNGICHQVHLERFGRPGAILLGSDSHTPTGGGMGMIAIGAGGLDVAVAMGGGPFFLTYPRIMNIVLKGRLRPWVSAKDVILEVLRLLGTKGNVGWMIEYSGDGVKSLTVPERATIANMGAETGVTASVFPSDEQTLAFLRAQDREAAFFPLEADAGAAYDREITIDLGALEPLVACPHSPGNVARVRDVAGVKVDQVLIGSCTNSSLRDLMIVAEALKGATAATSVSLGVAAGSRQVLRMIAENGALASLIASGARILECACGFCIGNSMAPPSRGVSLRTINRNFEGRSGTADAQVYLVSPETAAASAITGVITDPRLFFSKSAFPAIVMPQRFTVDDTMIIEPPADASSVEIIRGPNIGAPPRNDPMPATIEGVVGIRLGDNITTDHIMPAGNRLKYRSNIPRYAEFVFERIDSAFASRALADKRAGVATIIVAGESYGQGSSREHAAICPMYLGVKIVLAKSIERIHKANLVNFGILPAIFQDPADYEWLQAGHRLRFNDLRAAVRNADSAVAVDLLENRTVTMRIELSAREREILLAGGLINATRAGL